MEDRHALQRDRKRRKRMPVHSRSLFTIQEVLPEEGNRPADGPGHTGP